MLTTSPRKIVTASPQKDKDGRKVKRRKLSAEKLLEGGAGDIIAKPKPAKEKVFNDPIHGHVTLHPLCCSIVDTPQFQRLRDLLQVGPSYFVFPGASHRRFAHCIGVSYLAGVFLSHLKSNHNGNIAITEADELCIKIAGLCHDLGHGPFSHTYDGRFVKALRTEEGFDWAHEHASAALLDFMLQSNEGLLEKFKKFGLGEEDVHFIKELIFGSPKDAPRDWVWKGRGKGKEYLYEIVANHRNGIDVDKFDYFARDCLHLGIPTSFDPHRLMRFARVMTSTDGTTQIGYHEKEAWNIYELFHTRYNLHKRAYQHRVARAVEAMLVDALIYANDFLLLSTDDLTPVKMSHAMEHMDVYTKFTDSIFKRIEWDAEVDDNLKKSEKLLLNVQKRKLYKFIGETLLPKDRKGESESKVREDILKRCASEAEKKYIGENLIVDRVKINYGMGDSNPVDHVLFYLRDDNDSGGYLAREQVSCFIPQIFEECYIRLYCKSEEKAILGRAEALFNAWMKA
eukprot:g8958.t1